MMEIWFYKGVGNWFDRVIRLVSRSRYSHCEIIVSGIAYSADAWNNQVRSIPVSQFNRDNWDVVKINPVGVGQCLGFINSQLGKKYDWLGAFSLPFGLSWLEMPNRWYCSEFVAHAIGMVHTHLYPGDLFKILNKTDGENNG